jgi:hypothetical protein
MDLLKNNNHIALHLLNLIVIGVKNIESAQDYRSRENIMTEK